ncbi:hypothetical protein DBR45_36530 [Pseudomonas sp. HMWF031]|jgi:hypothetical protein|nr:hypothetical protein DBR45_36530 [Pseudomonas sp. HMWF031]
MAHDDKRVKIKLEPASYAELCEEAAARNVDPDVLCRETVEAFLKEFREAESDPEAMRALQKKLGLKEKMLH